MCGIYAVMFQIIAPHCKDQLVQVLVDLAEMRESDNFSFKDEADYAVGAAVKSLGPREILQALPLQVKKRRLTKLREKSNPSKMITDQQCFDQREPLRLVNTSSREMHLQLRNRILVRSHQTIGHHMRVSFETTFSVFPNNANFSCRDKATSFKSQNDTPGFHVHNLLKSRLWSLLPSFCNNPTDISANFKVCTICLDFRCSNY